MKTYRDAILMALLLLPLYTFSAYGSPQEIVPAEMPVRFDRIQVPFIENKNQIPNKEVAYFAKLFDGYIHVEKNGILTYNYSSAAKKGIVISELLSQKPVSLIPLEPPPEFAVEVFKQKGQIDGAIGNYYRLSYGRIYEGIELQLLAFADNLEKLFTIAPGGDPETITITVRGAEGLKLNDSGALEIQTKQGSVTFNQPRAYQLVDEDMKPVEVSYTIRNRMTYGFKPGGYDKKKPLIIGPFLPPALLTAPSS